MGCLCALKLPCKPCEGLCRSDLNDEERERLISDLVREITALWQTDELRRQKPSALDGDCCHLLLTIPCLDGVAP